jgi:hypothetical protein
LPQLEKLVVDALEDIKGRDIEVINTSRLTALFDRIVIACGDSNRQVKSLAAKRSGQGPFEAGGCKSFPAKARNWRVGAGRPRRHRRACHAAGGSQLLQARRTVGRQGAATRAAGFPHRGHGYIGEE